AIVNAHFGVAPPTHAEPMTGVVNGTSEWIFCFPARIAVTISSADRLLEVPRERLAADIWREVAEVIGLAGPLPRWQIIKERRASGLLECQRGDGHFVFELEADATIPAEYVLLKAYLGEGDALGIEPKIGRYLRRIACPGGGWPLVYDGEFDMSASVKAYFAL